ncbi:hypothetical protein ACT3SY_05835 [Brachybacterium sp. AOP42-E1-35]|uniref:hypothetical protein n=1 Tax=Brachybacterium sp. AOP42-E1-35 TaxID=3457664 RepID=UPI00402AC99C
MRLTRVLALAAAASLLATGFHPSPGVQRSVAGAYDHLDEAMDEWQDAPALRLPSSYHRGFLDFWDNSVTYDNALVAIAYANHELPDGQPDQDSLERARVIGDSFLLMQENDPIGDGRLRNAYGPEDLFDADDVPNVQTWGSATGNNAWAGMALMHIHHATDDPRYLEGAQRIGAWLIEETWDDRGAGGFRGGFNSDGTAIPWNSSEHNIDAAGLFGMLYEKTDDSQWGEARDHAEGFVEAMWMSEAGHFAIGTTADGVTLNTAEYIPEDVQSWGTLLLHDGKYDNALDWSVENLQVTDKSVAKGPITGVRFALQINPDALDHNDSTVWLEGTAHTALALKCTDDRSNAKTAKTYLHSLKKAQKHGPNADGKGIQANSSVGYAGGDDTNYTSLHTGATSWYIMAQRGINPFHLGDDGRC